VIENNLMGSPDFSCNQRGFNPSSQAVTIGRRLMLALGAETLQEEAGHLEVVQELLQNLDPVQRRNVQQILVSLGGKLWAQSKSSAQAGDFPALKIKSDRYGDMTAISCRVPGQHQPHGKKIALQLRQPNLALPEGLNLFRLETGEPIIIRFSDTTDCRIIHEIVAPFGCVSAPGSS
jgi:hypothetical protein